ncbi:ATP-binding protein [Streptomyces sp. SAS_275]|uniref:ATP-binding protein n=1 Tax=Streptomyces sp. SAS_275 TaxID=3412746 RepID=UPI00403CFE9B
MEEQPRFQQSWPLNADTTAASKTRIHLRTWLTVARWDGNVDQAARVAGHLADNAVRHGKPLQPGNLVFLRVFVLPDTNELAIEVEDALPDFPRFADHANQSGEVHGQPGGLWWVPHYHGRLSWDVTKDDSGQVVGKTVQALIPATWDGSQ